MREIYGIVDDMIDILEIARKTAPNHELSEEQKANVKKKISKASKKLKTLEKVLGVE